MTHRKPLGNKENPPEIKVNSKGIPVPASPIKPKQSLLFAHSAPLPTAPLAASQPLSYVQQRPSSEGPLKKMLQHTAKGEEKEVEAMLQHNYLLALTKGSFQEEWCGQRKWQSISPLQYAAWAGDTKLVDCFLRYLPTTEARWEAFAQLNHVRNHGTEHGVHLSAVYRLLEAYKKYNSKSDTLGWALATTLQPFQHGRVQALGTSQLHTVANLMQWFCNSIPFYPLPNFNLPVRRSLQFNKDKVLDLSSSSDLGTDCYLYKADDELFLSPFATLSLGTDYAAINQFCITRTENLYNQLSELAYALRQQMQNLIPRSPFHNKK